MQTNEAATEALKHGLAATNGVSSLLQIISDQLTEIKTLQQSSSQSSLALVVTETIVARIARITEASGDDAYDKEQLRMALVESLQVPPMPASSPEELAKLIYEWKRKTDGKPILGEHPKDTTKVEQRGPGST